MKTNRNVKPGNSLGQIQSYEINLIDRKVRVFESKSVKYLNFINLTRTLMSKGSRINCRKSIIFFPVIVISPDDNAKKTHLARFCLKRSLCKNVSQIHWYVHILKTFANSPTCLLKACETLINGGSQEKHFEEFMSFSYQISMHKHACSTMYSWRC